MGVTLVSGNLGSETLSGDFLSYYFVKLKKMASTSSTVIFVILSAYSLLMRATAITDWDTPYANAVTKATNEHRQSQGLEPLTLDNWLTSTAQEWADHLASSCQFDHRPLASWPENARAENIAGGCEFQPKGSVAVIGWKNSPGHNKNMLGDHKIMGVGFAKKRGCIKFCQTSVNQDEQEATVTVAMYGVPLPNVTSAAVDTP